MNTSDENIIYSQHTLEFVAVANEYCKMLENINAFSLKEFIENVYKLASLLHIKALSLPDPDVKNPQPSETFITEADWHYIDSTISKKLGDFEIYTDLYEPENPDTPVNISMSECLTDTYQDLKDFTKLYNIAGEEVMLNALYECKRSFEQFWGPRILTVMKEFHNILYGNVEITETEKKNEREINSGGNNWVDKLLGQ